MSRLGIEIVAKNKASAALGKTKRQINDINKSAGKVNTGFKKMAGLAAGVTAALGAFKLARGFLQTAKQFEQLGIQLKFITGSAEDGAKALKTVEAAAKRSAFSLESMAQAAPLLLTVSSIEQLNDTLDITGDIAAATGLSFDEVAGQLQRAFSGGIAAADIFREKGIKAMLGFQEGVQYSAEETEKHIRDLWENNRSVYIGAMEAMSKTWTGQVSMMGDAWLDFKKVTMEEGVFSVMKEQLGDVQEFVKQNKEAIDDFARALGTGVAESIIAIGKSIKFIADHSDKFVIAVEALVLLKLAKWFKTAAAAALLLNQRLIGVLAMSGPAGWALMLGGAAAVTFGLNELNKALGITKDIGDPFTHKGLEADIQQRLAHIELIKEQAKWHEELVKKTKEGTVTLEDLEVDKSLKDKLGAIVDFDISAIENPKGKIKELWEEIKILQDQLNKMGPDYAQFGVHMGEVGIAVEKTTKAWKHPTEIMAGYFTGLERLTKAQKESIKTRTDALNLANMEEGQEKELLKVRQESVKRIQEADAIYKESRAGAMPFMAIGKNFDKNNKEHIKAFELYSKLLQEKIDILGWEARETDKITGEKQRKLEQAIKAEQDALRGRVLNLRQSLRTESEIEDDRYRDALADLKAHYKDKLDLQDEYHELVEREEARHEKILAQTQKREQDKRLSAFESGAFELIDFEHMVWEDRVDFITKGGRMVISALAKNNKLAFNLNKAFAIADSINSMRVGMMNALKKGAWIEMAMIGAMGAIQIAAIKNTQYSGRRHGGPVSNEDSYIVGESGPELFTPGATGRITSHEGMIDTRPVNVNFNIQATDASSVDELIVARRGMIVNMVRQATQERGNRPNF